MPDETPEQWAAGSRREQGLSECVEDRATVRRPGAGGP